MCAATGPSRCASVARSKEIAGTGMAFAAVKGDGSVVCWGNFGYGGNCAAVQEQLTDVKEIAATGPARAAVKGSVVC